MAETTVDKKFAAFFRVWFRADVPVSLVPFSVSLMSHVTLIHSSAVSTAELRRSADDRAKRKCLQGDKGVQRGLTGLKAQQWMHRAKAAASGSRNGGESRLRHVQTIGGIAQQ